MGIAIYVSLLFNLFQLLQFFDYTIWSGENGSAIFHGFADGLNEGVFVCLDVFLPFTQPLYVTWFCLLLSIFQKGLFFD